MPALRRRPRRHGHRRGRRPADPGGARTAPRPARRASTPRSSASPAACDPAGIDVDTPTTGDLTWPSARRWPTRASRPGNVDLMSPTAPACRARTWLEAAAWRTALGDQAARSPVVGRSPAPWATASPAAAAVALRPRLAMALHNRRPADGEFRQARPPLWAERQPAEPAAANPVPVEPVLQPRRASTPPSC